MKEQPHPNTLFIGLGGTGGRVLKELRMRLYDEQGGIPSGIGFMYVDSSDEMMRHDDPTWMTSNGYDAQFPPMDFLNIGGISGRDILDHLSFFPTLKGIAENCIHLEGHQGGFVTSQNRRLGRVLMGANGTTFSNMLRSHVVTLQKEMGYSDIKVHIITGLSGGTGSGAVVSVTAHIFRMYPEAKVSVYATLPLIPSPYDHRRCLANTYAALRELNALNIGRLKITDLDTGEQWQPGIPYESYLNNCHHLPEKKTFRLFLFDKFLKEYDKIANILYHNLSIDEAYYDSRLYLRHLYMDGITSEPEFDASTPEDKELVYARTKAVGALGLCRIVYPRKLILQYLAQSATSQAICQMLYNNYRDGLGFIDETTPFNPEEICRLNTKTWHLDYESLTLQHAVAAEDGKHAKPFIDNWTNKIYLFSNYKEAKIMAAGQKNAFDALADYAKDVYLNDFCQHSGVETYFADKRHKASEYAKEFYDAIEQRLFSSWLTGKYGLYQLRQIYEALEDELKDSATALTKRAEELRLCVADKEKNIDMMLEEVRRMSKIQIGIKELTGWMQRRFSEFGERLVSYYSDRTGLESLGFAQDLTQRLLKEIELTGNQLSYFIHILQSMDENAQRQADDLLASCEQSYLKSGIINLGRRGDVEHYKELLFADREFIERLAAQVRIAFADGTEQSFFQLSNRWEYSKTADCLLQSLMESITAYDLSFNICPNLLRTNILHELKSQFPTNESLSAVVRQAIEVACGQVKLDDEEVVRAVPNNPHPLFREPREVISVRIPQATTMEEKTIIEEVKKLCLTNSPNTQVEIEIDSNSPNPDEISVASIRTNFPIRFMACLPDLKRQYDQLMADERQQAKYMLHTEDSFTELPSLEIEGKGQETNKDFPI